MTLLEGTLQKIIGDALSPIMSISSVTLHAYAKGTFSPGSGAVPTYTDHTLEKACFPDSKQIGLRNAGLLEATEGAVIFYQNKLPSGVVPKPDDELTIRGDRLKLVRLVDEDPAQATLTFATVDT